MKRIWPVGLLWVPLLASPLVGCSTGSGLGLGSDGSFHPDATAPISDYTGQGHDGEGWAGNSNGEGGPSAVQEAPSDAVPR